MKHFIAHRMLRAGIPVFLLGTILNPASADSLWQRRDPRRAFLVEDSRARRPGDLLTILIAQTTEVDNREDRDMDKSTNASGVFNLATATGGDLGASDAEASLQASKATTRGFNGEASYRNSQEFLDRMTVRVIHVDEVGNLSIEGHRHTEVSGEVKVLNISGVVRAIDIGPDNTINSRFISDLHMHYDAAGTDQKFTRQGWLSRRMNKVWPF